MLQKIGLGGGCHWCTEAIFQSLRGVMTVDQGWIGTAEIDTKSESEAVIVHFDPALLPFDLLIEIHLRTHNATSNHPLRKKYRSAIYTFDMTQHQEAEHILKQKQLDFDKPLITKIYRFGTFRRNDTRYLNYYRSDPERPFCQTRIEPKLQLLMERYGAFYKPL
jgi:peptide-methionine (S)-S-oxide reductase